MDREAWRATVQRVTNSWTWLKWISTQVAQLVKYLPANTGDARDMSSVPGLGRSPGEGNATHSSILAWKTPSAEDPGGLQSMEPHSIGHDWAHITKNHSILRPINKIEHLRHIAQRKLSVNIRSIFSHVSSYLARAGSHTLTSMVSVAVKHSICCHATDVIWHPIVSFDKGIFRSSYYFFSKHNICH